MAYFSHKSQNRDQWKVPANPAMKTLWYMTFRYILLRKLIGKNIYHTIALLYVADCAEIVQKVLCIQRSNDKHQLNANPHLVTLYIIYSYSQY